MTRDNRSLEGCGIGIVEVRMLSCMSLPVASEKVLTSSYVVDAADVCPSP